MTFDTNLVLNTIITHISRNSFVSNIFYFHISFLSDEKIDNIIVQSIYSHKAVNYIS